MRWSARHCTHPQAARTLHEPLLLPPLPAPKPQLPPLDATVPLLTTAASADADVPAQPPALPQLHLLLLAQPSALLLPAVLPALRPLPPVLPALPPQPPALLPPELLPPPLPLVLPALLPLPAQPPALLPPALLPPPLPLVLPALLPLPLRLPPVLPAMPPALLQYVLLPLGPREGYSLLQQQPMHWTLPLRRRLLQPLESSQGRLPYQPVSQYQDPQCDQDRRAQPSAYSGSPHRQSSIELNLCSQRAPHTKHRSSRILQPSLHLPHLRDLAHWHS